MWGEYNESGRVPPGRALSAAQLHGGGHEDCDARGGPRAVGVEDRGDGARAVAALLPGRWLCVQHSDCAFSSKRCLAQSG